MTTDSDCIEYAEKVLTERSNEAHLERHIHNLLECVWDTRCETQYYIYGQGIADLVCLDRKVLVEVKKPGSMASPGSQFEKWVQQLARYFAEWHKPEQWIAILTDGTNWYSWEANRILIDDPQTDKMVSKEQLVAYVKRQGNLGNNTPPPPAYTENLLEIFGGLQDQLENSLWPGLRENEGTQTKLGLWRDMLRGSGMVIEDEEEQNKLFRNHTMLASVVRMVKANLIKETQKPHHILADGYWSWVVNNPEGEIWAAELKAKVDFYDWREGETDIFRNFYEQVIDKKLRQNYGEYYTPDWLAQAICEEVLDEDWLDESIEKAINDEDLSGIGVLDPACGSGTFLYHAAKRILKHPRLANKPGHVQSEVTAKLIFGIDVHPIAVEIAQVTLLRALPKMPSRAISVYQGDSLGISEMGLTFKSDSMMGDRWVWNYQNESFELPTEFVEHPKFPSAIKSFVSTAVEDRQIPKYTFLDSLDITATLEQGHTDLKKLIKKHQNGVWAWYILNSVGPKRISNQKVDRVIANPPWVRYSKIQEPERKVNIRKLSDSLGLWAGSHFNTSFDIASVFIIECEAKYLNAILDVRTGWVTPSTSITSGQWKAFRIQYQSDNTAYWDLSKVREAPFLSAASAVWFRGTNTKPLQLIMKTRISRDEWRWDPNVVEWCSGTLKPIWQASEYHKANRPFRNGATLFPQVLVKVKKFVPSRELRQIRIVTCKSRKGKWGSIPEQTGDIPSNWLRDALFSSDLLVYTIRKPVSKVIVPVNESDELIEYPTGSLFWDKMEDIWQEYRGIGNNPKLLTKRINYNNSLHIQLGKNKPKVVYNASGGLIRSSKLEDDNLVIENKLLWLECNSMDEANYLVGIINSTALEEAFKLTRETDRDFQQHPLKKIPVPIFNSDNTEHMELAQLSSTAESIAISIRDHEDPKGKLGQIKLSNTIREGLRENGISAIIDQVVATILPDYV